jgi:hypothetical protein
VAERRCVATSGRFARRATRCETRRRRSYGKPASRHKHYKAQTTRLRARTPSGPDALRRMMIGHRDTEGTLGRVLPVSSTATRHTVGWFFVYEPFSNFPLSVEVGLPSDRPLARPICSGGAET